MACVEFRVGERRKPLNLNLSNGSPEYIRVLTQKRGEPVLNDAREKRVYSTDFWER